MGYLLGSLLALVIGIRLNIDPGSLGLLCGILIGAGVSRRVSN